jgi:hypothetical protein
MGPDVPNPSNSREVEAFKRELYRKSMDRIRVFNPTESDFVVLWGTEKYKYVFPNKNKDTGWGKGQRVIERYIAEKYARDMKDFIINRMADNDLKSTIERMEKAGVDNYLWKANESFAQSGKYKTDNPVLIKEIYEQVWLGVEEEFGMDTTEPTDDGQAPTGDTRTVEEQVLSTMNKKYIKKDSLKTNEVLTEDNVRHEIPKQTIQENVNPSVFPINKNKKKKLIDEVS